jgi:hypothetical protein
MVRVHLDFVFRSTLMFPLFECFDNSHEFLVMEPVIKLR